jgi:hypothetical protein
MKTGETLEIVLTITIDGDPIVLTDFSQIITFIYFCQNLKKTIVQPFALDNQAVGLDPAYTWLSLTAVDEGSNVFTLTMILPADSSEGLIENCDRVDIKAESHFITNSGDVIITENEIKLDLMKKSIGEGLYSV